MIASVARVLLQLDEQSCLLIGQRIVEAAVDKEFFGCGDRHQFEHAELLRPLDASTNQPLAQPLALILSGAACQNILHFCARVLATWVRIPMLTNEHWSEETQRV